MRKTLIICVLVVVMAGIGTAGDVSFSLNINSIPTAPRPNPATEAQLALWNDPMNRLLYHFNQEQAWIMRGAMPGGERSSGLAIAVRAQGGVPLEVLATQMWAGSIASQQSLASVRWPWIDDETLAGLPLDERLSIELGRRLVPK